MVCVDVEVLQRFYLDSENAKMRGREGSTRQSFIGEPCYSAADFQGSTNACTLLL